MRATLFARRARKILKQNSLTKKLKAGLGRLLSRFSFHFISGSLSAFQGEKGRKVNKEKEEAERKRRSEVRKSEFKRDFKRDVKWEGKWIVKGERKGVGKCEGSERSAGGERGEYGGGFRESETGRVLRDRKWEGKGGIRKRREAHREGKRKWS